MGEYVGKASEDAADEHVCVFPAQRGERERADAEGTHPDRHAAKRSAVWRQREAAEW